ncbi:hypothetical protein J8L13_04440 [Bacteroides fragilis]|uniref:hypothetical protein n=1 Tax=Bacteroides fragilis TaxID=817 RepID=UPI00202EA243|nr:hypothetical protein [Bacteroides fragilis]MCM0236662.1 hypothetical protein [Bacteroides fragilis]
MESVDEDKGLKNFIYYKLESIEMAKGHYLGSPILMMNISGNQVQMFAFFDLEQGALDNVVLYAKQIGLNASVEAHNTDSIKGTMQLLPSLPKSSFIHIDPYEID